ncbi:hypothetical protein lerEdw1_008874 [Lerista edwardsae]|nr:hypothetical protein lerEdw1_008874 [Lerista edwardsae]
MEGLDVNGRRVKGPYTIIIRVVDINDNPPEFDQKQYYGVVRQNCRAGKPFIRVSASDRDDPTTPNAQLSYHITHQLPTYDDGILFQINNITGEISPNAAGALKLNPTVENEYNLIVAVYDMGGPSLNSFSSSAGVLVAVKENLWINPPPVKIMENSTQPHPVCIPECQVQWNEPDAKYEILMNTSLPKIPFMVAENGTICVTEPLDREKNDSYVFRVAAKDQEGDFLARPVTVTVIVEDINDNPPECGKALTKFEVQENERIGNYIGTLHASDRDEKDTVNSFLMYRIVDQSPKVPQNNMFLIADTGRVQLFSSALNKRVVSNYSLKVEVKDPLFHTFCDVQVNVIDINDQIPIFEKSDYGFKTLPEDLTVGTVILEIQATDADEPFTGSSEIVYKIVKGDPNGTFSIATDRKTNRGFVRINKVLDFETAREYELTINATNPEPLVNGVNYNSSSVAVFRVYVTDVDEAPAFMNDPYVVDTFENLTVGSLVTVATAFDPEGAQIRYRLINNNRNWLRINPINGSIYTIAPLDRETEKTYMVQIVATEQTKAFKSSTAQLILNLKDVNDNPPILAKESLFFCHPLQGGETAKIEVSDPDERSFIHMFSYTLLGGSMVQANWDVSKPDAFSITLEMCLLSTVNVCTCTDENKCYREVENPNAFPTVAMAVGIIVAVLVVIGIILGIVFLNLKRKKERELKASPTNAVSPAEVQNLTT